MVETAYEDLPRRGRRRGQRTIQDIHHPEPNCSVRQAIPEKYLRMGEVERPMDVLTVLDQNRKPRDLAPCDECRIIGLPPGPYHG